MVVGVVGVVVELVVLEDVLELLLEELLEDVDESVELLELLELDELSVVEAVFAQSVTDLAATVSAPSRRLLLRPASTVPGSPLTTARSLIPSLATVWQSVAASASSIELSTLLIEFAWAEVSRPFWLELPQPVMTATQSANAEDAAMTLRRDGMFTRC